MKETKVYVDELPKSCSKCEWCTLNHKDNYGRPFCLMTRKSLYNGDRVNEERGQHKDSLSDFDCPLIDIKVHDRELVKEVCEKIREKIVYYPVSVLDEAGKVKANTWGISKKDIENLINQIQKEFEK